MWMKEEPEAEVVSLDIPSLDELLELGPSMVIFAACGDDVIVRDRRITLPELSEESG